MSVNLYSTFTPSICDGSRTPCPLLFVFCDMAQIQCRKVLAVFDCRLSPSGKCAGLLSQQHGSYVSAEF